MIVGRWETGDVNQETGDERIEREKEEGRLETGDWRRELGDRR